MKLFFDFLLEKVVEKLEGDEKVGGKIILRALEEPARQIAVNAGLEPAIIVNQIKSEKPGIGFYAKNEKYIERNVLIKNIKFRPELLDKMFSNFGLFCFIFKQNSLTI